MNATLARQRGFTLLELLVTVVVATIFLTVVPPSFNAILTGVRLKVQIYDFNDALNYARSEAVKRGIWVSVCASADGSACGPSGTNWESGWIVFVDRNNNQVVNVGDTLLVKSAIVPGYRLRGTSGTTLTSYITFSAKGAPSASGTFILCKGAVLNPSRAILIGSSGRITSAQDHNGIPKDASGTDMTTCTP